MWTIDFWFLSNVNNRYCFITDLNHDLLVHWCKTVIVNLFNSDFDTRNLIPHYQVRLGGFFIMPPIPWHTIIRKCATVQIVCRENAAHYYDPCLSSDGITRILIDTRQNTSWWGLTRWAATSWETTARGAPTISLFLSSKSISHI